MIPRGVWEVVRHGLWRPHEIMLFLPYLTRYSRTKSSSVFVVAALTMLSMSLARLLLFDMVSVQRLV